MTMPDDHRADSSPARIARVITAYTAEFANPIAVHAGDVLLLSDRTSFWLKRPEWSWIWCTGPDGRSGWTPESYIQREGDHAVARCDYDATELTVLAGEELIVEKAESGWLWCTTRQGQQGWVPAENVVLP